MAVLHPLESRMQQTKARAKRILFLVWLAPIVVASPFLYPSEAFANTLWSPLGTISRLTCFIQLPEGVRRGYYTFLFVFIYLLPLLFIGGTCVQVARCLLRGIPVHRQGSIRRQEANRRKIAKMVLIMVLAFTVAWTPYFLVSLVTQYQSVNFMERENFFFTMLNINLFAFLNSCVNPFIYAAMSTRFRNGFLRCFRCVCCNVPIESGRDMVSGQADRTKRVRFRCQPACLVLQSSSDGCCSNVASDASLRTVYTLENNGRSGSILGAFTRRRQTTERKLIAHYIKKSGKITLIKPPTNQKDEASYALENRLNALVEIQSLPSITKLNKASSSAGDVSSLDCLTLHDPSSEKLSPLCVKKWSSCLTVDERQMDRSAF